MLKLLIVDDEQNIRRGLQESVDWASIGIHKVFAAEDGQSALDIVEKEKINIIISDIKMPSMNGIELGLRVSNQYPNVAIILLSGYSEFEYAQQAVRFGACDYLLKPVKIPELLECVQKCLQLKQNQRNLEQLASEPPPPTIETLLKNKNISDKYRYEGLIQHEHLFGSDTRLGISHNRFSATILQALDYINLNKSKPISVNDVALFVQKSNNYFSHQFKKEVGISYVEYLNLVRIEYAKIMLLQTSMMTYEIAENLGFNDYKYFSTVFRKIVGVSPSQYKKK